MFDCPSPAAVLLAGALAIFSGAARAEAQAGSATAASPPSIERFMRIRAPASPQIAPDGAVYVIDSPDGINQLHAIAPGERRPVRRLTDFPDGISSFHLSPSGATIVIAASVGGNEQDDFYALDTATSAVTPLLRAPDVAHRFGRWLADSSGFVYMANDTSRADFHVYRYDLTSGSSRALLTHQGHWSVADVTRNGERLLLVREYSASHSEAWELTAATGALRNLDVEEDGYNRPWGYLPDERAAVIVSDREKGIRRLFVRDLATQKRTKPLPDLDEWEIEEWTANDDRSLAAVLFNVNGAREMRVVELPGFETVPMEAHEAGLVRNVEIRGRTVSWTLSSARNPGIGYAVEAPLPAKGPAAARAITEAEDQGIDLAGLTLPESVRYASFDGLEIQGLLHLPAGYVAGTRLPFVVNFHGGPESQWRPGFQAVVQYLLSRGYGVFQPNVRGSSGFGRRFHMLDNHERRWDSVRDGVLGARWLVENGYAESGRIAAYGRSYGGFMAVAAVIENPTLFGAAVDVAGIVNFETYLDQTKAYRQLPRQAEYGFRKDKAMLASISPIGRIDEIRAPMLIAHGLNDPRVPVGEAMQLAIGLQQRGHDPELLYFPDEGHDLAKLSNRLLFAERLARFLDRTIGSAR